MWAMRQDFLAEHRAGVKLDSVRRDGLVAAECCADGDGGPPQIDLPWEGLVGSALLADEKLAELVVECSRKVEVLVDVGGDEVRHWWSSLRAGGRRLVGVRTSRRTVGGYKRSGGWLAR